MAFSWDTTIAMINNAVNEFTRAQRDFGDERPDKPDDPIALALQDAHEAMAKALTLLEAERNRVADAGTNTPIDVQLREPEPPKLASKPTTAKSEAHS